MPKVIRHFTGVREAKLQEHFDKASTIRAEVYNSIAHEWQTWDMGFQQANILARSILELTEVTVPPREFSEVFILGLKQVGLTMTLQKIKDLDYVGRERHKDYWGKS